MIIGVVSDTHGHAEFTRPAVRMLESAEVELVIHCGDIGSPQIVGMFSKWPTHFVFGNVDLPSAPLADAIRAAGQTCHQRFGQLELAGRKIAFLHGDDVALLSKTIGSGDYDLVCCGHTHQAECHAQGKTTVLNPGALYRANRHTFAVVRLTEMEISHLSVD